MKNTIDYNIIINQMTLEEKASLLSGKDFWTTQNINRLNIPSIFLADCPHGIRKQAVASDNLGLNESIEATCFPTSATIANSWDLDLINSIGKTIGKEAVDQDVNVLLGHGTNIKRNPLCGRNFDGSLYYMFNYPKGPIINGLGGGLAYFIAIQITLAIAQIINFFYKET